MVSEVAARSSLFRQLHEAIFPLVLFLLMIAIVCSAALYPLSVSAEPLLASTIKNEVMKMTPDAMRSLVERAAASWVQGDAKAFAGLFAPDGEFVVPGQRVIGVEAIEKVAAEFAKGHTQVRIKIQRIITDRQQAVIEWHWEDTETSTGKQTQADDAIVVDFADSRIKRWREYIDSQTPP